MPVTRPADSAARDRDQQAALERAFACAFWRAVQQQPMPIMAALEAAARTVGTLYRQVAAAHGEGSCGCGWQPDPETDLIVLEAMLAAAARPQRDRTALAALPVAGHA